MTETGNTEGKSDADEQSILEVLNSGLKSSNNAPFLTQGSGIPSALLSHTTITAGRRNSYQETRESFDTISGDVSQEVMELSASELGHYVRGGGRSGGGVGKGGNGSGVGVGCGVGGNGGGGDTEDVGVSGVADKDSDVGGGVGVKGGSSGEFVSGSGGGRSGGGVCNGGHDGSGGGDGSGAGDDEDRGDGGDSGVTGENENDDDDEDDGEGDGDDDDENDNEDDGKDKGEKDDQDGKDKGEEDDKDNLDESHRILLCESSPGVTSLDESSDNFSSGQVDTLSSAESNYPVPCSSAQLNAAAVWNGTPPDTGKFSDDDCRRWKSCKKCLSREWKVVYVRCGHLSCRPCSEQLIDMKCTFCGELVEDIKAVFLAHENTN